MSKIKKILLPLDGSKNSFRGLDEAILLAKKFHAQIRAVYVRPTPPIFVFKPIKPLYSESLRKEERFLDNAKKRVQKHGIKFSARISEFENPGEYIVKLANREKCDHIVIGARGMGSAKEFFLGSTSHHVVQKAKIPVLVVK